MKIWPFDPIARENNGQYITRNQMRTAIDPLRQIKQEFGDEMDVAMEFHGFWNLHSAIQIAQACEEYSPMWLEEMLPQDNLSAYAELAAATSLPLCVSERLMTRWGFRELLDNGAARIVMPDISWCGGISEARRKLPSARRLHYVPSRRITVAVRCCTLRRCIWPPMLRICSSRRAFADIMAMSIAAS